MRRLMLPLLALAALPALASCEKREVTVTDGWVRLSPNPDAPSAAYFTVKGGSDATQLSAVGSEVAIRFEMHETVRENGMMQMKPLATVEIPANSSVKFEPGGKHVMIWNINPGIKPGQRMNMVFTFANGAQIEYPMAVRGADGAAPAAGEHAGNHSG